jgi:hypothetical protein
MRVSAAVFVVCVAITGAVIVASLRLGGISRGPAWTQYAHVHGLDDLFASPPHDRAPWQIPVAIAIAALGVGAAAVVAPPRFWR